MTRCLDEATLQSYFDGELSPRMMESATSHLASCSKCAAAAREVEEEIHVLTMALADDFEASVPTERLRQRIDAAVLDHRVGVASAPARSGFGAFVASLLSFGTQRTFGYASLAVLLAFGAILGVVKLKTTPQGPVQVAEVTPPVKNDQVAVVSPGNEGVEGRGQEEGKLTDRNTNLTDRNTKPVNNKPANAPSRTTVRTNNDRTNNDRTNTASTTAEPVRLIPGERAYLQTIARLDSTIQANKKTMRPSLQVEYERNLAVVDRAIAATRSAAKSNPNDPDAADFMFAAYQSKVDLLNTIADARVRGGRSH